MQRPPGASRQRHGVTKPTDTKSIREKSVHQRAPSPLPLREKTRRGTTRITLPGAVKRAAARSLGFHLKISFRKAHPTGYRSSPPIRHRHSDTVGSRSYGIGKRADAPASDQQQSRRQSDERHPLCRRLPQSSPSNAPPLSVRPARHTVAQNMLSDTKKGVPMLLHLRRND
jgi:hypothetical protein